MIEESCSAVDAYISDLFVPYDSGLVAALKASAAAGLPEIQISPSHGKLLYLLARIQGARQILELGTLGGYSTIWLGRALPAGGRLMTLESDSKHAAVARSNIAHAGLANVVELRVGPAIETLPQLVKEGRGPFDLIFLDADKESYPDYLPWLLKLARRGTVLVADNVVRNGAVIDQASNDPRVEGVQRFNVLLAADARVSSTVIQTVGTKGYDGFALGVVIGDL